MKNILIIIIIFSALPCFAELTENDIRQIRQVIREEIKPLEDRVGALEKQVLVLEIKMEEKFKAVDDKLSLVQTSVDDKLSLVQWFIGGLVALVVAAIAIPQLLILYREKKEAKEIDKLRDTIAELQGKKLLIP